MDTRVLFLHQHSESAIYLVSLQFPSDWGGGYRLPVYLCQCAVVDHNLNTIRSKQWSCGAVRIIIIYHSFQANTREIYFGLFKLKTMSSLTVFSRISSHKFRFWAITIIIYCLDLDLIGHVGGSSRHDEFWNIGHSLWGPVLIHVFLSPLYSVLQTGPIGLISCQWLHRGHYQSVDNLT